MFLDYILGILISDSSSKVDVKEAFEAEASTLYVPSVAVTTRILKVYTN